MEFADMKDLDWYLGELGWRRRDLCARLGLHKNTPGRWVDGPPQYVMAYLDLALGVKRLGGAAAELLRSGR